MNKRNLTTERDRETTEKRLLSSIGEMICEQGFEKIGINAVAAQSGVSKILIYRYFGSLEGLLAAYIQQYDFWINFPDELPLREEVPVFLKKTLRNQIAQLRENPTLKKLYRWELSSDNEMTVKLRELREEAGSSLVRNISRITGREEKEMAALATILNASITYLVMLEDFCPVYNGIPIKEDSGWEQISQGMDLLIDLYFPDNK